MSGAKRTSTWPRKPAEILVISAAKDRAAAWSSCSSGTVGLTVSMAWEPRDAAWSRNCPISVVSEDRKGMETSWPTRAGVAPSRSAKLAAESSPHSRTAPSSGFSGSGGVLAARAVPAVSPIASTASRTASRSTAAARSRVRPAEPAGLILRAGAGAVGMLV
jgi:hypothetical protein